MKQLEQQETLTLLTLRLGRLQAELHDLSAYIKTHDVAPERISRRVQFWAMEAQQLYKLALMPTKSELSAPDLTATSYTHAMIADLETIPGVPHAPVWRFAVILQLLSDNWEMTDGNLDHPHYKQLLMLEAALRGMS